MGVIKFFVLSLKKFCDTMELHSTFRADPMTINGFLRKVQKELLLSYMITEIVCGSDFFFLRGILDWICSWEVMTAAMAPAVGWAKSVGL